MKHIPSVDEKRLLQTIGHALKVSKVDEDPEGRQGQYCAAAIRFATGNFGSGGTPIAIRAMMAMETMFWRADILAAGGSRPKISPSESVVDVGLIARVCAKWPVTGGIVGGSLEWEADTEGVAVEVCRIARKEGITPSAKMGAPGHLPR